MLPEAVGRCEALDALATRSKDKRTRKEHSAKGRFEATSPGDGLRSTDGVRVGVHPGPTVCRRESVNPVASRQNLIANRVG